VQDFIPAPMDVATCIHYTGLDPYTMKPVKTVRRLRDRQVQRALLQFFAPENYFAVREALTGAGRRDLIGDAEHCLIPSQPPRAALAARRERARSELQGGEQDDAKRAPGYRRAAREGGQRASRRRGRGDGGGAARGPRR
jgi:hypothetical protein